jgi:hypothetical protein
MEDIEFITYYDVENLYFRTYNNKKDKYENLNKLPEKNEMPNFHIPSKTKQNFKNNDEDLKKYSLQLLKDREQIYNICEYDYFKFETKNGTLYHNHSSSIEGFFNFYAKKQPSYTAHKKIDKIENIWFNNCYNAGLMSVESGTFDNVKIVDFKRYYQYLMTREYLKIPLHFKEDISKYNAELKNLKIVPKNIMIGIYRVKITCDNTDFKKIFAFSKNHHYTHFSLKFCVEHKEEFNINIDLIIDGKPNALVYHQNMCEPFKKVCYKWSDSLDDLKLKCSKDNTIIKLLRDDFIKNYTHISSGDINDDKEYFIDYIHPEGKYYKLIKKDDPYFYNFRLKPFLTDLGRITMAETMLQIGVSNVKRVYTDSIAFIDNNNINIKQLDGNLELEDSGKFIFSKVNKKPEKL